MVSIVPLSDEQAKAATAAIEAGRAAGGYVATVLGTLPEDLVGWAIGDRIAALRWENAERLYQRTRARLEDQGVKAFTSDRGSSVFISAMEIIGITRMNSRKQSEKNPIVPMKVAQSHRVGT